MIPNAPAQTARQSDIYLPYDLKYIPEDIRKRAESELFEDEETRIHSLKLLRLLLKDETNLHCQNDDTFLLAFLRCRKYDVKRAFDLVKKFYNIKEKHKEIYNNFNYDDVRKTLEENSIGFLPYRDNEGCVILVIRTETWNPSVNSPGDMMRALTCSLFHSICSPATQIAGFKVILDLTGCGMAHISHTYLWLLAEALQDCFPGRFKAVHLVNEGYIIYYVWSILKPLLNKKVKNRLHFHGRHIKKLHKSFSPKILPAEFHGNLPPFDNSEWAAKMEESSAYLTYAFSHGYKKKPTGM